MVVGPEYTTALADPFNSTASAPTTAVDAAQDLQLAVRMPKAVAPGESVSVTLEVVSKSKAGGSPVEFHIDPIPASVTAAGMTHTTVCCLSTTQCCLRYTRGLVVTNDEAQPSRVIQCTCLAPTGA